MTGRSGLPYSGSKAWGTVRRVGVHCVFACALMFGSFGAVTTLLYEFPALQVARPSLALVAAFTRFGGGALLIAALLFALSRRRIASILAGFAAVLFLVNMWWFSAGWFSTLVQEDRRTSDTRVLTMNLRCISRGTFDVADRIRRVQPDVAVINGIFRSDVGEFVADVRTLPARYVFLPMPDLERCGTLVLSSHAVALVAGREAGDQQVVRVNRPGFPYLLVPVDLPTPSKGVGEWQDGFERLRTALKPRSESPVIVAGDFNAVSEHSPLRRLEAGSDLADASQDAGWTATFKPKSWLPPLVALDHVLVNRSFSPVGATTYDVTGQNHLVLVVDLQSSGAPPAL